jgi:hypothetical protein
MDRGMAGAPDKFSRRQNLSRHAEAWAVRLETLGGVPKIRDRCPFFGREHDILPPAAKEDPAYGRISEYVESFGFALGIEDYPPAH